MQNALAVVTVVVVGLMVGVEFAVAVFVNPILDRLPDNDGIRGRIDGARVLGRVMPFWYTGSLVLGGAWTALARGGEAAPLALTATLLLVATVVMSLVILVPINSRVTTWTQEGLPEDWKDQVGRWDRFHFVRVGLLVLALTLFAVALV